jgi:hypothetical protein
MWYELQMDFIKIENIKLNIYFSLACTHHKLNFEIYRSKIFYFVNRLVTILYLKYLLIRSDRVQFLSVN